MTGMNQVQKKCAKRRSSKTITAVPVATQSQKLRRRFFIWLVLFVALAGRSDRNRLEISISMSLESHLVQHFRTPRETRLKMPLRRCIKRNEVAKVLETTED